MARYSEIIRSPSTGIMRRVFKGQRLLVVSQRDEDAPMHVDVADSDIAAKRASDFLYRRGHLVHYVETAELVSAT